MKAHHDVVVNIDSKTGEIFVSKPGTEEAPK